VAICCLLKDVVPQAHQVGSLLNCTVLMVHEFLWCKLAAGAGCYVIVVTDPAVLLDLSRALCCLPLTTAGACVGWQWAPGVVAEDAVAAADEFGYPVLLKATGGGGGRGGIFICNSAADEVLSQFGDVDRSKGSSSRARGGGLDRILLPCSKPTRRFERAACRRLALVETLCCEHRACNHAKPLSALEV